MSVAQFTEIDETTGQNPLQAAMKSTLAIVTGFSESDIELLIKALYGRRALSIQISFTIKIETADLATSAVTALQGASASGVFSEEFKKQAKQRGEVVDVVDVGVGQRRQHGLARLDEAPRPAVQHAARVVAPV